MMIMPFISMPFISMPFTSMPFTLSTSTLFSCLLNLKRIQSEELVLHQVILLFIERAVDQEHRQDGSYIGQVESM